MKKFIFMAGTTGAGKTTHGRMLADKLGVCYISSGDIARKLMDEQTAQEFKEGKLSPHEDAIRAALQAAIIENDVLIFDGFPRVPEQNDWLDSIEPQAKKFAVMLQWDQRVLVGRWLGRMRDEFDTLKAYVLRDELYVRTTLPLFTTLPRLTIGGETERNVMEINAQIRQTVLDWLKHVAPDFKPKDSSKQLLIDKFIHDHHITFWRPDRMSTFAMKDEDIEKKLWDIVHG